MFKNKIEGSIQISRKGGLYFEKGQVTLIISMSGLSMS